MLCLGGGDLMAWSCPARGWRGGLVAPNQLILLAEKSGRPGGGGEISIEGAGTNDSYVPVFPPSTPLSCL